MQVAQINPDGSVIKTHKAHWVTIGEGVNAVRQPPAIFKLWSDDELNAIGYAKFTEDNVPSDKRSTGTEDTFKDGKVHRTHTTRDHVPPPDPLPTIEDPDNPAYTEEVPAVTEFVPAVTEEIPAEMSEDGKTEVRRAYTKEVTPPTTREVSPAKTIEHPAKVIANPTYKYADLRLRDYEHTPNDMIIALWEKVMEGNEGGAASIETKRQAVKTKYPKGS
jgi:hypothetical protein